MKLGNPSTIEPKTKMFVAHSGVFFEKEFSRKRYSGRTIELDMIVESEQDEQSSAASEMVPEAATTLIAMFGLYGLS